MLLFYLILCMALDHIMIYIESSVEIMAFFMCF